MERLELPHFFDVDGFWENFLEGPVCAALRDYRENGGDISGGGSQAKITIQIENPVTGVTVSTEATIDFSKWDSRLDEGLG